MNSITQFRMLLLEQKEKIWTKKNREAPTCKSSGLDLCAPTRVALTHDESSNLSIVSCVI